MELWPHQKKGLDETWKLLDAGEKRICFTSPTGGGKTVCIKELILKAVAEGKKVALYTNRISLTEQISRVLDSFGIDHGLRAAGFERNMAHNVQICSLLTENSRVFKRERWDLHDADICICDEAHQQKRAIAVKIFTEHINKGAALIGFTATPVGIGHLYRKLVVAGNNKELRDTGALLPCVTYGPDEPDLEGLRPNAAGEYSYPEIQKRINNKALFGRVLHWWKILNPFQKPTLLFAPGVSESKWFVDQFEKEGVCAAHIDGNHVYYGGEEFPSSIDKRMEIIEGSKIGDIKVICNRFVMREGIDMPWLAHCIMATPFGSLVSYLQAGGRLLRAYPGLDIKILQDHGANFFRHGSLNEVRNWSLDLTPLGLFSGKQTTRSKKRQEKLDPLTCPKCFGLRAFGTKCPHCGYESVSRWRYVVQSDGTLKKMTRKHAKRAREKRQISDAQKAWWGCYFGALKGPSRGTKKLKQVAGWYYSRMGKWPSSDLIGVPDRGSPDWELTVADYHKLRRPYSR